MDYNPENHNAVFARIEQKLDSIQQSVKEIKENSSKLSDRVNVLENFKYYLVGFAAILSIFGSYIAKKFFGKDI